MQFFGVILVAIAAISYGVPASLIKLAEMHGSDLYNVLFFMFAFSFAILLILAKLTQKENEKKLNLKGFLFLCISGSSIALTNIFYFNSLKFQPVSVSAVLLMQSVWIAVLLDCIVRKKLPTLVESGCTLLILLGTLAATGGFAEIQQLSLKGLASGLAAALFYALTMRSTGHMYTYMDPVKKSAIMSLGAFLLFTLLCWKNISTVNYLENAKWGGILTLFSMVLPIVLFSTGMPKITSSLGGILSSLELPSAVFFSWVILDEHISIMNASGVMLIVISVVIMSKLSKEH